MLLLLLELELLLLLLELLLLLLPELPELELLEELVQLDPQLLPSGLEGELEDEVREVPTPDGPSPPKLEWPPGGLPLSMCILKDIFEARRSDAGSTGLRQRLYLNKIK